MRVSEMLKVAQPNYLSSFVSCLMFNEGLKWHLFLFSPKVQQPKEEAASRCKVLCWRCCVGQIQPETLVALSCNHRPTDWSPHQNERWFHLLWYTFVRLFTVKSNLFKFYHLMWHCNDGACYCFAYNSVMLLQCNYTKVSRRIN